VTLDLPAGCYSGDTQLRLATARAIWRPPQSLVDAVGLTNGHLAVAGLGIAEPTGPSWADSRDKTVSWRWLKLKFGQTVLARQRQTLSELLIKTNRTVRLRHKRKNLKERQR
jgi:hypothetical protein